MVNSKQIAALKYLVFRSEDTTPMVQRIFAFLLDKSEGLTRPVYLTLTEDVEGFTGEEISNDAHAQSGLVSCNCRTHLSEVLAAAGTDFRFDVHYGHFEENGKFNCVGMFSGLKGHEHEPRDMPLRYTYWLAPGYYSKTANRVTATRTELESINTRSSGLYPSLEDQKGVAVA